MVPAAGLTLADEWLEADGLGGFASGTTLGARTRRYHALLLAATRPPTARVVLVNGLEATIQTVAGAFPISTQCYQPDIVHPDGWRRIEAFSPEPWPQWAFCLEDGTVGASHQTGWTGLAASLMQESEHTCPIATGRAFGQPREPAASGGAAAGTGKASRRE